MKKELILEKNIKILSEKNNHLLCKDKSLFYILRKNNSKTNNIYTIVREYNHFHYFGYLKLSHNDHFYEGISFYNSLSERFPYTLFKLFLDNDKPMSVLISKLIDFFNNQIKRKMDITMIRGLYAELYWIKKNSNNLKIPYKQNSIYDFQMNEENKEYDLEIKAISKVKREIQVSLQQLTNSTNAILVAIEVCESSDGVSLKDLFYQVSNKIKDNKMDSLFDDFYKRYSILNKVDLEILKIKFNVEEIFKINMKKLVKGFNKPKYSKNVKVYYNVQEPPFKNYFLT